MSSQQLGQPELSNAEVVVVGGRGVGGPAGLEALRKAAGHLGAAVGCTRALVDEGLVPNEQQVVVVVE